MLDRAHPMQAQAGGWYEATIPDAGAGHALQVSHRWRDRGSGSGVALPAAGCVRAERGHRSRSLRMADATNGVDGRGRMRSFWSFMSAHSRPAARFVRRSSKLDHVVETGLTAIELMPIADFAGRRNWGYDGVLLYAPDSAYGRPDDLRALIDAAHARGLMVFLDVVYNHFGPEGNYLHRYAPGFFAPAHTPWGHAIDLSRSAGARLRDRQCAALADALSLRRPAARRRSCHRGARSALDPA